MDMDTLTAALVIAAATAVMDRLVDGCAKRIPVVAEKASTKLMAWIIQRRRLFPPVMDLAQSAAQFGLALWLAAKAAPVSGGDVFGIAFLCGLGFWFLREAGDGFRALRRGGDQ